MLLTCPGCKIARPLDPSLVGIRIQCPQCGFTCTPATTDLILAAEHSIAVVPLPEDVSAADLGRIEELKEERRQLLRKEVLPVARRFRILGVVLQVVAIAFSTWMAAELVIYGGPGRGIPQARGILQAIVGTYVVVWLCSFGIACGFWNVAKNLTYGRRRGQALFGVFACWLLDVALALLIVVLGVVRPFEVVLEELPRIFAILACLVAAGYLANTAIQTTRFLVDPQKRLLFKD